MSSSCLDQRKESVCSSFFLFSSSCFTIACKLESRRVPDTNSLLSLFDARHHVTSILLNHGEKQLLTQLDFELGEICFFFRFQMKFQSIDSLFESIFRISIGDSFSLLLSSIFTFSFRHVFTFEIYDRMCFV